jgi:hypothetical protein
MAFRNAPNQLSQPKNKRNPISNRAQISRTTKVVPPTPLKRARATENLLIVWCGDSTKEILETNKQTAGNLRLPLHDPLNQQTKTTLLVDSHKQPVL